MAAPPKTTVIGWGSADLIGRLKQAAWVDLLPPDVGKNFTGISIGGYQLTIPADNLCSVKFRVTAENLSTGKKFAVEGYGFKDIETAMKQNAIMIGHLTFVGEYLTSAPHRYFCRYRATIEVIKETKNRP